MFEDNSVINNFYNKMNELESLEEEHLESRGNQFFIIMMSCAAIIGLNSYLIYPGSTLSVWLNTIGGITAFLILLLSLETTMNKFDPIPFIHTKTKKNLLQKEQECSKYISDINVQKELLTFKRFDLLDAERVKHLKKSLALQDFSIAYKTVIGMIKELISIESRQVKEKETDKLIAEYEQKLS